MLAVHGNNNRLTGKMRDRLQTTSMGLGLMRLQMDVGPTEEARPTLASLQVFVQRQARLSHLRNVPRVAPKLDELDLDRRLIADLFPGRLLEEAGR